MSTSIETMIRRSKDGRCRILSLSYGKDSMACLGAVEKLGWSLDRIVTADIWAKDNLSANLPVMQEFKDYADKEIFERYGIRVEHYRSPETYESLFYRNRQTGRRAGAIRGFPMVKGGWCIDLKTEAIRMAAKSTGRRCVEYIGIAKDEPERLERLSKHTGKISPLAAIGWTEEDCFEWCESNGLLSPVYNLRTRDGCWFCHKQGLKDLRLLYNTYPQLWAILMQWDSVSPVPFHQDGHSVHDYDKRFRLENEGVCVMGKKFRWNMIEGASK